MSFTFGSLFAGIGGFDLGLERAGMECKWQVEIDDFCNRVLEKHWPHVKRYRDVREVGAHNLEPVDLICGGFPCQPFSVAGKQRGKEDDRHLWPEMLRVVSDVRPAWVVGENVDGLVRMGVQLGVPKVASRNLKRGPRFDCLRGIFTRQEIMLLFSILEDLEALGYGAVPLVIPACGVDAPHLRYRVWIVGHSDRSGRDAGKPSAAAVGHGGSVIPTGGDVAHTGHAERRERDRTRGRVAGEHAIFPRKEVAGESGKQGEDVAHAEHPSATRQQRDGGDGLPEPESIRFSPSRWDNEGEWFIKSGMGRVAHGIPRRVDRLRSLGNAVVPQVVEVIGKAIMEANK